MEKLTSAMLTDKGICPTCYDKEIAKENNCVRIELNCWEQNENALNFYKKLGLKTQKRVMEININLSGEEKC